MNLNSPFVMKILNLTDDRADKWKLSLEYKIFIALVRNLWLHAGFFNALLVL